MKGNNTYQFVHKSVLGVAMDGSGISYGKSLCITLNRRGGAKNSWPFIVICPALTFFVEKVLLWIFILLTRLLVKSKLEVMLLLELIFGTEFTNDEAS